MIALEIILLAIIILFAVSLWVRNKFSLKICALCSAVFLTWASLLVMYYLNRNVDPLMIGILAGGSIAGLMYLLESKLPEKFNIFKLPFYLILVVVVYVVISVKTISHLVILVLFGVILFSTVIYLQRNNPKFKKLADKVIECCKNW